MNAALRLYATNEIEQTDKRRSCCKWKRQKLENPSSPVDMHAGNAFDNRVTLTFDLLTSGSMHADGLPWSIRLPTLVLIAQVVFF